MAGLILKNLEKIYEGGFKAVNDFNLEINHKEFIVFVGPSGCGKSTTLRMIAGLEEITAGELYIDEKLMNDVEPKNRDIAMVFQNYALYPHMTVYENMAFGLKIRKTPKKEIEEKVKNAAEILGIETLLKRKPKSLSGGQRQRVAMGRAIVRSPKVFLMDEPLSNLDAKLRVQMRLEISKLYNNLDTTFVYVTHDQIEAMTLGTRIVVMHDGVIQQVDTPTEIYNNPKNLFVATFIGSPQMNLINGRVFLQNNKYYLKVFEEVIEIPEQKEALIKEKSIKEDEVIIGVRPENVYYTKEDLNCGNTAYFEGKVELVEHLGSETYVYVKKDEESLTIKARGTAEYKRGDIIQFGFNLNNLHIFNKEDESTIF